MFDFSDRERDDAFCDELVRRGWATREQADEARELHARAQALGQTSTLDDIFTRRKWVTPQQCVTVRREVAATTGSAIRVGKYEILTRIGEGGAGIVYRAWQVTLNREVALKVLSRERETDPEYLDQFMREARVAVTLNHVNIVRGLDYGNADGYHFFAMELVDGETFLGTINREGVVSEPVAIDFALQMVRALEHAQKFRIVHRDIKPENILITKTGVAKLCDLGLAKPIIEGGQEDSSGRPMGTALYVAPEQIRQSPDLGFEADIYSLGCTLFHALTGQPPYSGATAKEIIKKHLSAPVPNPRDKVLEISSGTASVVMKMMSKDPADRYQALEALEEDLDACLDGRPPVNTITIGRKAAPLSQDAIEELAAGGTRRGATASSRPRSKVPVIAGAVLLVGILAAAAFFLRPGEEPIPAPPPPPVQNNSTPPSTSSVDKDAMRRAREDAAVTALGEAELVVSSNGEDSEEALAALRAVAEAHKGTEAGSQARDRVIAVEKERRERRETAWAERSHRSTAALEEGRLGEAVAPWLDLPEDWAGTDYETRAAKERERLGGVAAKRLADARVLADRVSGGDETVLEDARRALGVLADSGLAAVSGDASALLQSMEASVRDRREKAAAAQLAWGRVLPQAVLAAAGGVAPAREVLDREAAVLTPVQADVDFLRQLLDDMELFLDAVPRGWAAAVADGRSVELRVPSRPGGVVKGRAKGGSGDRLEVQRGPAVEAVDLDDVHPEDRAALAWSDLGAGTVRHHRGAAIFFLAHGCFSGAETEIRAVEVMGAKEDLEPIRRLFGSVRAAARARADEALKEAEVLLLQRRVDAAGEAFSRAVQLCEGYARSLWKRGAFVMEHAVRGESARDLLEAAAAAGPEDAEAWYHIGEARRRDGDLESAVEGFEKFLGQAPEDSPLREAARTSLEEVRAAAVATAAKDARSQAAKAYRKEDYKTAEEQWRRVLKYVPDDAEAVYFLGKTLLAREEWVDGYLEIRRYLALGASGSRERDAKDIVKDMERRLADSPEATRRHQQGVKYYHQKQYREAVDAYGEAIFLAPLREESYVERSEALLRAYLKDGRREDLATAARDAEVALAMNDRNGTAWDRLALARFLQEKWPETVEAARMAIERNPLAPNPCNVMARACNHLGKFAQAEEAASEGIRREPKAVLFLARAEARVGMSNLAGAREDLDTAAIKYDLTPGEAAYRAEILGKVLEAEKKAQ